MTVGSCEVTYLFGEHGLAVPRRRLDDHNPRLVDRSMSISRSRRNSPLIGGVVGGTVGFAGGTSGFRAVRTTSAGSAILSAGIP
jgi:hypothetical protein